MSTVAELWGQLTDDEKTLLFKAAEHFLPGRGGDLIIAVDHQAQTHTQPFPYLPPPETIPHPDHAQTEPLICADCHQPIHGEVRGDLVDVNGSQRPAWLHKNCYSNRLVRKARGTAVDGDQLQAFPTPMPVQEEP